jgi:hypothetical protein
MNTLVHCPRKHFWSYEVGLSIDSETSKALHFGSAWHSAMEERGKGNDYDAALVAAIPEGIDLEIYACATIAGLLAGYYDHYGTNETVNLVKLNTEVDFPETVIDGTDFAMRGKIDGLGSLLDGRSVLMEYKTTGDSVSADSDYWLRLRFNLQVYQYVDAATKMGWNVDQVIYDVTRKPSIRPKQIGKGEDKHMETPDEYCDRLYKDTLARPEFYYARKEVPIIESDLQQFYSQRLALCRVINHYRRQERSGDKRSQEAWPRNVSTNTCDFCQYKSFCLRNAIVDLNNPPAGYSVKPFNPELSHDTTTEENTTAAN